MSWLKAKDWATGVEYSTLFHSGLRAISLRKPRTHRTRTCSSCSSSWEGSSGGRTSSAPPLPPSLLRRSAQPPSPSMSMSTESSLTSRPSTPEVVCRRQPSVFVGTTKEATYAWASEECFLDIGKYQTLPEQVRYRVPPIEIEGVRSLPGSRPLFTNMEEMEGDGSFLLLSGSQDMFLHRPDPRCECPVPLPPRRVREMRRNRGDRAWMLEESSPEPKAYEFEFEEARQLDDEPGADWRQFHVDLLATIR